MELEDIQIRRAEPDDYAAVFEIYRCPKVFAGTLQLPYPSLEKWKQRLAEPKDSDYMLVAIAGDLIVGHFGLHTSSFGPRRRHVGILGMGVHDEWQGKGVGTALMRAGIDLADNWFNLERLELQVYTDNEPAIRLYQRFGFEEEGRMKRYAFRNGAYVDVFAMARLRSVNNTSWEEC